MYVLERLGSRIANISLRGNNMLRKITLLVAILTGGCGDETSHIKRGEYILQMCGERPETPGRSAYFDGDGNAVLSTEDYSGMNEALEQLSNWAFCAAELD